MNQNSIQNSVQRYSRKRNSYEAIKTSFSLKNAKKSLPEVCIDLNQHNKKNRLALEQRIAKGKEPTIQISYFEDKKKGSKGGRKKDQLTLKDMYQTQLSRSPDPSKDVLKEYKKEIQMLRVANERLRDQNQRLKRSEEYANRRQKQIRQQSSEQRKELKQYANVLEKKVDLYSQKIKKLYEELIYEKRKQSVSKGKRDNWTSSTRDNKYHAKEIYSYRLKQDNDVSNHGKRFTSPSSPQLQQIQWTQEIDNLMLYERRGEEAYYKTTKGYYGTLHSDM